MIKGGTAKWFVTTVLSFLLLSAAVSHGAGPVHGAKAASMGTAFLAVADDPSAIISNPAGLSRVKGTNIYGGLTLLAPSTEYSSFSGRSENTDFQVFIPPHLYISSDFGTKDIVLGIGIYSPFGIGGRKWSDTGPTRYLATESSIATLSANPTIAWQLTPNLSIGIGLDYMIVRNNAERMTDQSSFGAGDGKFSLDGEGDGWGYNAGLLLKIGKLNFAVAYRSGIEVDVKGTAELTGIAAPLQSLFGGSRFQTVARTRMNFPEIWSFGIAYSPTKRLTLAGDFELARWSSFDEGAMDFETEVPGAGFVDSTTSLDWRDSRQLKVGFDYRYSDRISLRGGYAFIEASVPDHTLGPDNPDSDQHNFSLGFGYQVGKYVIDYFYNAGFYEKRAVNNSILDGEYENFVHYTGVSLGYRF